MSPFKCLPENVGKRCVLVSSLGDVVPSPVDNTVNNRLCGRGISLSPFFLIFSTILSFSETVVVLRPSLQHRDLKLLTITANILAKTIPIYLGYYTLKVPPIRAKKQTEKGTFYLIGTSQQIRRHNRSNLRGLKPRSRPEPLLGASLAIKLQAVITRV